MTRAARPVDCPGPTHAMRVAIVQLGAVLVLAAGESEGGGGEQDGGESESFHRRTYSSPRRSTPLTEGGAGAVVASSLCWPGTAAAAVSIPDPDRLVNRQASVT